MGVLFVSMHLRCDTASIRLVHLMPSVAFFCCILTACSIPCLHAPPPAPRCACVYSRESRLAASDFNKIDDLQTSLHGRINDPHTPATAPYSHIEEEGQTRQRMMLGSCNLYTAIFLERVLIHGKKGGLVTGTRMFTVQKRGSFQT
jgi:hypothetical protein